MCIYVLYIIPAYVLYIIHNLYLQDISLKVDFGQQIQEGKGFMCYPTFQGILLQSRWQAQGSLTMLDYEN